MLNGQLTKSISTFHGQSVQLTAEVFNLLSMLGVVMYLTRDFLAGAAAGPFHT